MSLKLPPLPSFSDVYSGRTMRVFVNIIENTFSKLANLAVNQLGDNQVFTNNTHISNSANSSTTLVDMSIPKKNFTGGDHKVDIKIWGSYANNSNNKQLTLYVNDQIIFDTGTNNSEGEWLLTATIIKTNTSSYLVEGTTVSGVAFSSGSLKISSTMPMVIKLIGTGTNEGDITRSSIVTTITSGVSV